MVDVKALIMLTVSVLLTGLVVASTLGASVAESVAKPRVVIEGSHAVLLVPLHTTIPATIKRIIVNGKPLGVSNIVVPAGASVLVIDSMDSVKVFRSMDRALAYVRATSIVIPGRPITPSKIYYVRVELSTGQTLEFIVKP